MKLTYHPLCHVNIWHGYYLHSTNEDTNKVGFQAQMNAVEDPKLIRSYSILKDLKFVVAKSSEVTMRNLGMALRERASGFSFYVRTRAGAPEYNLIQPHIFSDAPFKLTVFCCLKNPYFLNFTDIDLQASRDSIYYFSNFADNAHSSTLFLNRAATGSGRRGYVSEADRVSLTSSQLTVDLDPALGLREVRISLSDGITQYHFDFQRSEEDPFFESCTLGLHALPPGLYTLEVKRSNGEPLTDMNRRFFWGGTSMPKGCLAAMELFHADSVPVDYQLSNEFQQLTQPTYTLWWANRMTRWRYVFNRPQSVFPSQNSNLAVELEDNAANSWNILRTKRLQPLLERYRPIKFSHSVQLNGEPQEEEIPLPNPNVDALFPEEDETYSEIYMGSTDLRTI